MDRLVVGHKLKDLGQGLLFYVYIGITRLIR
jgi:hypothetical protein